MRRLIAGLIGIAVLAGVLAWFAQGVAVGEDHGERDQLSWKVMTAETPPDAYTFGQHGVAQLLTPNKSENFEGSWPNDWALYSTHDKFWGPNQCLAYAGSYDGWVEAFGPSGHPSHTNPPACTIPTGYTDDFETWMVYGPFSLAGKTAGGVSLQFLADTEYQHDFGGVYASTDCESFSGTGYWGDSGGWTAWPSEYGDFASWPSLGNILGQTTICVAFIFQSDSNHTGAADKGFFLDNINIWSSTGTPTATATATKTPTPTPTKSPSPTVSPSATVTPSASPSPTCPMCGDVNCDNAVDAVDAMFTLQYVVGLRPELCTPCCPGP
jgi:hypothetical protein